MDRYSHAHCPHCASCSSLLPCTAWKRIVVECVVVVTVVSWLLTLLALFSSRYSACNVGGGNPLSTAGLGRFINIRGVSGAFHWRVGPDRVLALARGGAPPNATFYVEWLDSEWFCLRCMKDLRVLEVLPPGGDQPWTVRARSFACGDTVQLFSYRGHSLFSKGVGSYLNQRELQYVRAHGDTVPWRPLQKETRGTRIGVDVLSPSVTDTVAFERRLLAVLRDLCGQGAATSTAANATLSIRRCQ